MGKSIRNASPSVRAAISSFTGLRAELAAALCKCARVLPTETVPIENGEFMLEFFGLWEKYDCIFCGERKRIGTEYILDGKIGVCGDCVDALVRMPLSQPFEGTRNISYILSPFEYKGAARNAIVKLKFNGCRAYAPLMAYMMRDYLNSFNIWKKFDMIIPVPLHAERILERGYNQSELICKYIAEYIGLPMRTDVLARIRATKRQSTLNAKERIVNVKEAFDCSKNLSGKHMLLFDDICTTGNTLNACAEALAKAGAEKICALTFSKNVRKEISPAAY